MATGHDGGGPSQSASNHPALASASATLAFRLIEVSNRFSPLRSK